jgi:hypothetical protein
MTDPKQPPAGTPAPTTGTPPGADTNTATGSEPYVLPVPAKRILGELESLRQQRDLQIANLHRIEGAIFALEKMMS